MASLMVREPWYTVSDESVEALVSELRREAVAGHPLYDVDVVVIARREDRDDVAFMVPDGRVAVVHLTWSGRPESNSRYPTVIWYEGTDAFQLRLDDDHSEFEATGG